ncbi:MAG: efflux RND transporter permease subunit [Acidobacteriota bacterium]
MLRTILERPVSVAIATLTLVILGLFSLLRLPVSLLPTLERPRLVVTVLDADQSRDELVRHVAQPLERRLMTLPGVLQVHTTVDDGECTLRLATEWQTDVDRLRIDAERRLSEIAEFGVDELLVRVETGDSAPILGIAVAVGETASARTVFADKVLIPELGRLAGAGQLKRLGGASLRPVVRPHAAALAARGLTADDLVQRLFDVGRTRPAGRLRDGGRVRPLVVREPATSVAELASRRLDGDTADTPGATLGELASIAMEEVPDASLFRLDGKPAVLVEVYRAPGANAVLLARAARQLVTELSERSDVGSGPGQLQLETLHDASLEVIDALLQLAGAAFLGLLLGTLVLRFMLGSWRPTLALAVVVPASIVSAFGGFLLWGVSLDVVSLAGLALAAGMLVDNSIVVLEAIALARQRASDEAPEVEGTRQIGLALVASFLTTAVVFLPLLYLQGLARAFFGVQAFAIVTSLAVSLALSLTLTPVLARRMAGGLDAAYAGREGPGRRTYLVILERGLAHPALVILITLAVLVTGALVAPTLPRELMPAGSSSALTVDFQLPPGLDQDETARRVAALDRALVADLELPPARHATLLRRQDPLRRETVGEIDRGEVELTFAEASGPGPQLEPLRRELVRRVALQPGLQGEVTARRSAVTSALETTSRRLEIELTATTVARVERLAERVTAALTDASSPAARVQRAGQGPSGSGRPRPSLVLGWDSWRLAQLGADASHLENQVQAALGGFYAGRTDIPGAEPEILVAATRPSDPRLIPVRPTAAPGSEARVVPLAALAELEPRLEPAAAERLDGRPAVRLSVDLGSAGVRSIAGLERRLAEIPLAIDERIRLGGQAHELQRSFSQLRLALGLALVLVFLTIAALYESLAMPLVVMTTVPVAAAGGLGALWLTGNSLNVMSFLGLILLAGIVVNNAIVLVHRIEQRIASGHGSGDAIRQAARERYRPILMTTLTTLLGMLPLALLGGQGAEMRASLAIAVCGGLVTSFYAALVVVPVLHRALVHRSPAQPPVSRVTA